MARSDYLDPRWQKFRLKRLEIAGWRCESCGSEEDTLHVHHLFYISGRKPWEYLWDCTLVLCEECHACNHEFAANYEKLGVSAWEQTAAEIIQKHAPHSGFRKYIEA